jgi:hypothetical protein
MEGPTSSGGSRNRITRLNLHEHDDDDDDRVLVCPLSFVGCVVFLIDALRVCSCLQNNGHCIKNRKVAGSIPDGVIGMFH